MVDASSPVSDCEAESLSLDGSSGTSSKTDIHGYQLQEYLIPTLTVFGRRITQEDNSLIGEIHKLSEMLPYPDATPIITLGRGKKKTRSISQMSPVEMQKALTGFEMITPVELYQQESINQWSGVCSSSVSLGDASGCTFPQSTSLDIQPILSSHPAGLTNGKDCPPLQGHDWSSKNKLHLTVNTNLPPIPERLPVQLDSSGPSEYPFYLNNACFVAETSSLPQAEVLRQGMKSAPAMISDPTSFGSGFEGPFQSYQPISSSTAPYTASWIDSQKAQFGHPIALSPYEQVQANYDSQFKNPNDYCQRPATNLGYFDTLPTPSSATMSTILTPQSAYFPMLSSATPLLSKETNVPYGTCDDLSQFLPSATESAGLFTAPFDISSTFGHLNNASNFENPLKMINLENFSQSSQSILTDDYINNSSLAKRAFPGNEEVAGGREAKLRATTKNINLSSAKENCSSLGQSIPSTISLKVNGLGSRLKPGPKSKKTLVQHPPPLTHPGPNGEAGGIAKDILKCFYECIHQRGEDPHGGLSSNKRYVCKLESCGRIFPRKTAIESHIQTHLEDKPFVCPARDCNAAFVRQHDLRRHEHIHSGNKPFNCECGKGFARGDALMRHRQRGICVGSMVPRRC